MRSATPEYAHDAEVDVLIAGGGPFGLMLANELGRRDVSAATFARRLGFAYEVRSLALPPAG